jgi:hypothetical protein
MITMKQDRKNRRAAERRFDKWFFEAERKHARAMARVRQSALYSKTLGRFVTIPE